MDREFEVFRGGPNEALSKRLYVSINRGHLIMFNRNVYSELGRPEAVHLGYSRARDIIAVEAASPRLNDSFPVRSDRYNFRICAAPFCRHFGIRIDSTLKFVRPDIIGKTLFLNLGETISTVRPRRRKKN